MSQHPTFEEDYPDNALSLLEAMEGPPFDTIQMRRYGLALRQLHVSIGYTIVAELCLKRWRPSPEEILLRACHRFVPRPEEDQVYMEIMRFKSHWQGVEVPYVMSKDGKRIRIATPNETPTTYIRDYSVEPPWSHPVVAQVVALLSGWRNIQSGEAQFTGGFRKQVKDAYERVNERFDTVVLPELCKPEHLRAISWRQISAPRKAEVAPGGLRRLAEGEPVVHQISPMPPRKDDE